MSDGKVAAIIGALFFVFCVFLEATNEYSKYLSKQQVLECLRIHNGNTNNFCESLLK